MADPIKAEVKYSEFLSCLYLTVYTDGILVLEKAGFKAGDLVEIKLIEKADEENKPLDT